jgi:hypothetical protein
VDKTKSVMYGNKALKCDHCGNDEFVASKSLLTSQFILDFLPAWLTPSASVFACARCSRLHWFGSRPQSAVTITACIRCGAEMLADEDICPSCGVDFT